MRRRAPRFAALTALAASLFVGTPESLAARQAGPRAAGPGSLAQELRSREPQSPTELDQQRAEDTREELRRLMELYPPALGRILKLDPTLMTNASYMTPYPALVTFFERHPEVPRYPAYFLRFVSDGESFEPLDPANQVRADAMRMWRETFSSLLFFSGFLMFVLTLTWLIRYVVSHRRWLRATKLQSEVHGRLMERFSSNDELMAYVQSPAGRQFLQGLPAVPDVPSAPAVAMPVARILWAVQAGLVLGSAGAGLLVVRHYVIEEVGQVLLAFGVLGIAIGVGFTLAAAASYILSHRLGLFDAAPTGGMKGA